MSDVLWENPGLIDSFVEENPNGLPADELNIVRKWKRFVSGTFSISRYLKKHAIFIIKFNLREQYMAAKQNDRIITTLEPEIAGRGVGRPKPDKNWGPMVEKVVKVTEQMRGGPAIQRAALNSLRASARSAESAIKHPDDLYQLGALNDQVRKAYNKFQMVLNRAE